MSKLGCDQDASGDMFAVIDKGNSTKLTFDEFYDYFVKIILAPAEENTQAEHVFKMGLLKSEKQNVKMKEFREMTVEKRRLMDQILLWGTLSKGETSTDKHLTDLLMRLLGRKKETGSLDESEVILKHHLKNKYEESDNANLTSFLQERWKTFASFKRNGESGS